MGRTCGGGLRQGTGMYNKGSRIPTFPIPDFHNLWSILNAVW
jgi:hypothetical protein